MFDDVCRRTVPKDAGGGKEGVKRVERLIRLMKSHKERERERERERDMCRGTVPEDAGGIEQWVKGKLNDQIK